MNKQLLISYTPVILLIIVAINQIFHLQPVHKFSRWKGGGFGVYCRPYEYFLMTFLQVDGKDYLVRIKGSPFKIWANQENSYLNAYSRKFLTKSYLLDGDSEKSSIPCSLRECSSHEEKLLNKKDLAVNVSSFNYIGSQAIEKVKVQLWQVKLLNHNNYSSELIKVIENEK